MTKVFLLLLVFSYHFIQAAEEEEEEACLPGYERYKGECRLPRGVLCPPGKRFQQDPRVSYSKGRCVDIGSLREPRELSTAFEKEQLQESIAYCESCLSCTYLEGAKTMNQSAAKCPELSALSNRSASTTEGAGSCSTVDARCFAKVRCYPTVSAITGNTAGTFPPLEMDVSCAVVDGKCPEDPQDCIKDTSVAITAESSISNIEVEESLRRRIRGKRSSGAGVR